MAESDKHPNLSEHSILYWPTRLDLRNYRVCSIEKLLARQHLEQESAYVSTVMNAIKIIRWCSQLKRSESTYGHVWFISWENTFIRDPELIFLAHSFLSTSLPFPLGTTVHGTSCSIGLQWFVLLVTICMPARPKPAKGWCLCHHDFTILLFDEISFRISQGAKHVNKKKIVEEEF